MLYHKTLTMMITFSLDLLFVLFIKKKKQGTLFSFGVRPSISMDPLIPIYKIIRMNKVQIKGNVYIFINI